MNQPNIEPAITDADLVDAGMPTAPDGGAKNTDTTPPGAGLLGPMIVELRETCDLIEAAAAEARRVMDPLASKRSDLERRIMDALKATGQDRASVKGSGTASVRTIYVTAYEPARWPDIQKWFVDTGNGHCIQRRLTDAKVVELSDNGVRLPDGLRIEPLKKLSFVRT